MVQKFILNFFIIGHENMAKSKSDISNSAIRIFLQLVGKFYDEVRGFEKFVPTKSQKKELLESFNYQCCYCGRELNVNKFSQDHLIPLNKNDLGLHAWGNVVPSCNSCNNEKQLHEWQEFIKGKASIRDYKNRKAKIIKFVKAKNYNPNLNLHEIAGNLYQDVGEVAITLINLRYKQAEEAIKILLKV